MSYGGDFEARRRLLREIVAAIRASSSRPFTLGLRLCLDQMLDGGFGVDECQRLVETFTAEGEVDYFSLDIGNNWNAPSYIPIAWHDDHEWSPLAGQVKSATHLPVVYAGRVTEPQHAADILNNGEADLVALARATMADSSFATKAKQNLLAEIRPCIGLNECIHRKMVEGVPYSCGISPQFGHEREGRPGPTADPKTILVIGGGPAGSEAAALCAEQGHTVELWERADALGGALSTAAKLRGNHRYGRWIEWQTARLDRVGVLVRTGTEATPDLISAHPCDVILATVGADPRRPPITGIDQPNVVTAVDLVNGRVEAGGRIALVVEDDGPAPPTIADHLAGLGHDVTMIFQTVAPAPHVGKYSIGSMLGRLDEGGVILTPLTKVTAVDGEHLRVVHTFSGRADTLGPFDTVVLACGAIPRTDLYQQLKKTHPDVRLLGDAFAPRRTIDATRQAWGVMLELN